MHSDQAHSGSLLSSKLSRGVDRLKWLNAALNSQFQTQENVIGDFVQELESFLGSLLGGAKVVTDNEREVRPESGDFFSNTFDG